MEISHPQYDFEAYCPDQPSHIGIKEELNICDWPQVNVRRMKLLELIETRDKVDILQI